MYYIENPLGRGFKSPPLPPFSIPHIIAGLIEMKCNLFFEFTVNVCHDEKMECFAVTSSFWSSYNLPYLREMCNIQSL